MVSFEEILTKSENFNSIISQKVSFNDLEFSIFNYLSAKDKNDLIQMTIANSKEDNILNCFKCQVYFSVYLVIMYTDIIFSDKEKEDIFTLYDKIKNSGLYQFVLSKIPTTELEELTTLLTTAIKYHLKYRNSAAGIISNIITDLPAQAEIAGQIVDNFDPQKYQAVIDFAKAANGNRPIE